MLSLIILVIIAVLTPLILAFAILHYFRQRQKIPQALKKVLLKISVTKETQEEQEITRDEKELIGAMEQFLVSTSHVGEKRGVFGKQDHLVFEIASVVGAINFFVAVPFDDVEMVKKQIQAQFSRSTVEQIEDDYNIFTPESFVEIATLKLKKPSMYPIRTYESMDTDPLLSITNILTKRIEEKEGASIQICIRPVTYDWGKQGRDMAKKIEEGGYSGQGNSGKSWWEIFTEAITFQSQSGTGNQPFKSSYPQQESYFNRPSALDDEKIKALEEKTNKIGFETVIRVVAVSVSERQAKQDLKNILSSFDQFKNPNLNEFTKAKTLFTSRIRRIENFVFRYFDEKNKFILNSEELASIFHFPIQTTETPKISWLEAREALAPLNTPTKGLVLGENIYRNEKKVIRIANDDRRRHVYIIGMTGTGKTNLMQEMAKQDIRQGKGVCIIDPHGEFVEDILNNIPEERKDDVIVFDPSDLEKPLGLNMLEWHTEEQKDFLIQEMIAIFYKLFPPEIIGPMFEHNMRNAMLTLMADRDDPGTIVDIPRIFTDQKFMEYKLKKVTDPLVRSFWEKEMAKTSDFHKSEMLGYVISKVGRFVENETMRNIIGQPHSSFNFREIMDAGKIFLVNLTKGKVGEVNSSLLGLIIVSKLQVAAMGRADTPQDERKDFYLYVDEFQSFATDSFASILSEARKYRLNLTIAHQYITQLKEEIKNAVLGNVGSIISFRIGVEDAEVLAKEFEPVFSENDLINIEKFNAYVKLLIDGKKAKGFSMRCFPPSRIETSLSAADIIRMNREKYGKPRHQVEQEIIRRSKLGEQESIPQIDRERSL